MKICSKCKKIKFFSEFSKNKSRKDGYKCWCKFCEKQYNLKHKKEKVEYDTKYYLDHKKEKIEYGTKYY